MPQKRYTHLKRKTASVSIMHKGQQRRIEFAGGTDYPVKVNGSFYTNDPELQATLENHRFYGEKWKLTGQWPTASERQAKDQREIREIQKMVPKKPDPIPTEAPEKELSEKVIEGINTVQKAKDWLLENIPGTTVKMVQNKARVLEYAEKNNVQFPDIQ